LEKAVQNLEFLNADQILLNMKLKEPYYNKNNHSSHQVHREYNNLYPAVLSAHF